MSPRPRAPPPPGEREIGERERKGRGLGFQGVWPAAVFPNRGPALGRRIGIQWHEAAGHPIGQMGRRGGADFLAQANFFGPRARVERRFEVNGPGCFWPDSGSLMSPKE